MKLLRWCKANAMPVIAVLAAAVTVLAAQVLALALAR